MIERQARDEIERHRKALLFRGFPEDYAASRAGLGTYVPVTGEQRRGLDAAKAWSQNATSPWLYLWSQEPGTGKTHLAAAATIARLRRVNERGGCFVEALFTTFDDLVKRLLDAMKKGGEWDLTERYRSVDYLVLDDIALRNPTPYAVATFYSVVNDRYEHRRPTIFTANVSADQLFDFLGADTAAKRILSRMAALTEEHEVAGPDHRRRA